MNLLDLAVKITCDDQASEQIDSVSNGIKDKLATAGKVGAAAIGAVTVAAGATGAALVSAAGDVAAYGDNIDKMSQKMGMTAEAYQEWDSVMRHSGTSMETMKASMKTLANAAETGSEAFEKLGMSQEQIANMSQEQLFEATITALQNVEDTTERTYLAGQTLGRGATELGALLNTSAEETQAMRDRVHELGGVMSDEAVKASAAYQDSMQDMQTAIGGIKNSLMSEMLPSITQVMDGLQEVFSGNTEEGFDMVSEGIQSAIEKATEIIPKALELGGTIIGGIADGFMASLPAIGDSLMTSFSGLLENLGNSDVTGSMLGFVERIGQAITENAPVLLERGGELLRSIGEGITEAIPELLTQFEGLITSLGEFLGENSGDFISSAIEFVSGMAQAFVEALPDIISALVGLLGNIISTIPEWLPQLISAAANLIMGIASGILQVAGDILTTLGSLLTDLVGNVSGGAGDMLSAAVEFIGGLLEGVANAAGDLVSAVGDLIWQGIDAVGRFISDMWWAGANLVQGLIDGVWSNISGVADALLGGLQGAVDSALSFLGIASPSKLFRQIGEFTMEGFAQGIELMAVEAERAMSQAAQAVYEAASGEVEIYPNSVTFGVLGGVSEPQRDEITININYSHGEDGNKIARDIAYGLRQYRRAGAF